MSEFCIKSAIEVAIKKDIEVPDEATGLVFYESSASLVTEDEFGAKSIKVGAPSDKQMELINSKSLEPQEKENWMIIKGINPIGVGSDPDSHSDVFSKAAERDMARQAFWTPVIINHSHEMNPPIGRCLEATAGKEGLRETWAIPKASYNAEYREALMQGNMPEISIGAFIDGKDRLCNSCGDKSIYNLDCPHVPGRLDPKSGQVTTVTINRVKRYAERSLVNIPARLGTGLKSLAPEQGENKVFASAGDGVPVYRTIEAKDLPLSGTVTGSTGDLAPLFTTSVGEQSTTSGEISFTLTKDMVVKAFKEALEDNFRDDPEPPATISTVINEDSIVAEKDVKAPEAQEPSEKEEIIAPEATVAEEKTEAPEPQEVTIEVPVVKSLEVEELTKSFNGAIEVKTEELNKTLSSLTEKLAKQQEFSEKQGEALKSLSDSVAALAENVAKLASLSTEEAVEKLLEVAGQIKEQTSAPKPEEPMTKFSFIDSLRK